MSPKLYKSLPISDFPHSICTKPACSDSENDHLAAQKAQRDVDLNSLNPEIAKTNASIQTHGFNRLTADEVRLRDEEASSLIQTTELDIRFSHLKKELADSQLKGSQASRELLK